VATYLGCLSSLTDATEGPGHLGARRYFTMQKDLSPGTEVDFTLTLPAEITRGTEVFVRAHGRVVRVDKLEQDTPETMGVAAATEHYDSIRGEASQI
jgi:hypothetical protein